MENDRREQLVLAGLGPEDSKTGQRERRTTPGNLSSMEIVTPSMARQGPTATDNFEHGLQQSWGGVSGGELSASKVRKTRPEEVAYIRKTSLYTKVARSKATTLSATIITARWIHNDNVGAVLENYRSRLVAREIKKDHRPYLFPGTPPLEALGAIVSMCIMGQQRWQNHGQ